MRAKVKGDRLVLNEPTGLPEGAEVELLVVDGDKLDEEDRARLHAALDRADEQLKNGRYVPGDQGIARLKRTSP